MRIANALIGLAVAVGPLVFISQVQAQQKPDQARVLFVNGRNLMDDGRYADAAKQFREVLSKYPKSDKADEASFYLISTLIKLGQRQEALTEITSFQRNYPKSPWMDDVREKRISLTNQVPDDLHALIAPPPPAPPAPPAPGAQRPTPAPARSQSTPFGVREARGVGGPADPETSLQQEILRVLLMNNPDRGIEVASDRLKADPSDPVVLANLSAIATSPSSKGLPLLISIAKSSPSMKARRDATFWLARSRADKDVLVGTLLEILSGTGDPETENAAASALAEINTPRAMAALTDIARDRNRSTGTRRSALNALARFNLPNGLSTYEELYRNASDSVEMRRTLVNLIGRSTETRTVTVLANIAKTDSDVTVRRIAVQFLGNRKEPEAQRALEDLLK